MIKEALLRHITFCILSGAPLWGSSDHPCINIVVIYPTNHCFSNLRGYWKHKSILNSHIWSETLSGVYWTCIKNKKKQPLSSLMPRAGPGKDVRRPRLLTIWYNLQLWILIVSCCAGGFGGEHKLSIAYPWEATDPQANGTLQSSIMA